MPLVANKYAAALKAFIIELNTIEQTKRDEAIEKFAKKQEELIYEAIKSITITIPPGTVIITGPNGGGTNPAPIVLNKVVK